MRTDILEYLQKEIYTRCQKPTNKFGMGVYHHIEAVVKNGELLAEKYGADKEVVMIGAWLHDIASITDYELYEEHHIHGVEMAYDILKQFDYDELKIALVQACIRNHRGSVCAEKSSIEERCVADADAVSHFYNIPNLLYLAFVERGLTMEEGTKYVREKLERSYRKLSPESKEYYKEKYQQVMEILQ